MIIQFTEQQDLRKCLARTLYVYRPILVVTHSVGKIDQYCEMVLEPVTTLPGHAVAVRSLVKGNNFYTKLINYTDSDICLKPGTR